MQYIVKKQIELSGSSSAYDIGLAFSGDVEELDERDRRIGEVEFGIHDVATGMLESMELNDNALRLLQEQVSILGETQKVILERLGASMPGSSNGGGNPEEGSSTSLTSSPNVMPASA